MSRRAVVSAIAGALWIGGGVARAQEILPRVILFSSVGYSDNVSNSPKYPSTGKTAAEADAFLVVGPALSLSYNQATSSQRLSYTFSARLNERRPSANTYDHKLAYTSTYNLSPATVLTLGGDAKRGILSALRVTDPVGEALLDSLPEGQFDYLDFTGNQALSQEIDGRSRWTEKFSAYRRYSLGGVQPNPAVGNPSDPDSQALAQAFNRLRAAMVRDKVTLGLNLGYERDFPDDSVGPDINFGYLGTQTSANYLNVYGAHWEHRYDKLGAAGVSSRLDLGLLQLAGTFPGTADVYEPALRANVGYTDPAGRTQVSLAYTRVTGANLNTGLIFDTDTLTALGTVPLRKAGDLYVTGSAQWERDVQVALDGTNGDPHNLFVFDNSLTYEPISTTYWNLLKLTLRYTRRIQLQAPLPTAAFTPFDAMEVNTVTFTVTASLPARDNTRAVFLPVANPGVEPTANIDVEGAANQGPAADAPAPAPAAAPGP